MSRDRFAPRRDAVFHRDGLTTWRPWPTGRPGDPTLSGRVARRPPPRPNQTLKSTKVVDTVHRPPFQRSGDVAPTIVITTLRIVTICPNYLSTNVRNRLFRRRTGLFHRDDVDHSDVRVAS
jgi:hypothetical protein